MTKEDVENVAPAEVAGTEHTLRVETKRSSRLTAEDVERACTFVSSKLRGEVPQQDIVNEWQALLTALPHLRLEERNKFYGVLYDILHELSIEAVAASSEVDSRSTPLTARIATLAVGYFFAALDDRDPQADEQHAWDLFIRDAKAYSHAELGLIQTPFYLYTLATPLTRDALSGILLSQLPDTDTASGLDIPLPSSTAPITACHQASKNLKGIKQEICQYLEAVIRNINLPHTASLERGQSIARRINGLLADFNARLRIPGTESGGTLTYKSGGYWAVQGSVEGKHVTRALKNKSLATAEVVSAPSGARPGPTAT